MPNSKGNIWESIESWRSAAFTIAVVFFVASLVPLAINLAAGTQDQFLAVGQGFVGAAWTATFTGLLGFYPSLAAESRWPLRLGSLFAVIGLVASLTMAVVMFGLFFDLLPGTFSGYMAFFAPAFLVSIPLGCGLYGVVALRTQVYRQSIGLLILVIGGAFLFNYGTTMAGLHLGGLVKIFVVVLVLTLANLAVGYLLMTGSAELPERAV